MISKKLYFISVVACFSISSVYAYTHTVENRTNGQIKVVMNYAGRTLFSCRPDDKVIEPGQTIQISAGGCCLNQPVYIEKLTGSYAGSSTKFYPQTTGATISCTSNHIIVRDIGSKGILASRPQDL